MKLLKINKSFKNRVLFDNFNFEFENKGLYIITGKNGCGKTTLLKIITNSIPFKGKVDSKLNYTYIKKENDYIPNKTILDHLISVNIDYLNIAELFIKLKIDNLLYQNIDELSEGERKRVFLAIALYLNQPLLLIDEFSYCLDKENTILIMSIIKEYSKTNLVILVTHDKTIIDLYFNNTYNFTKTTLVKLSDKFNIDEQMIRLNQDVIAPKRKRIKVKKSSFAFLVVIFSIIISLLSFFKTVDIINVQSDPKIIYRNKYIDKNGSNLYLKENTFKQQLSDENKIEIRDVLKEDFNEKYIASHRIVDFNFVNKLLCGTNDKKTYRSGLVNVTRTMDINDFELDYMQVYLSDNLADELLKNFSVICSKTSSKLDLVGSKINIIDNKLSLEIKGTFTSDQKLLYMDDNTFNLVSFGGVFEDGKPLANIPYQYGKNIDYTITQGVDLNYINDVYEFLAPINKKDKYAIGQSFRFNMGETVDGQSFVNNFICKGYYSSDDTRLTDLLIHNREDIDLEAHLDISSINGIVSPVRNLFRRPCKEFDGRLIDGFMPSKPNEILVSNKFNFSLYKTYMTPGGYLFKVVGVYHSDYLFDSLNVYYHEDIFNKLAFCNQLYIQLQNYSVYLNEEEQSELSNSKFGIRTNQELVNRYQKYYEDKINANYNLVIDTLLLSILIVLFVISPNLVKRSKFYYFVDSKEKKSIRRIYLNCLKNKVKYLIYPIVFIHSIFILFFAFGSISMQFTLWGSFIGMILVSLLHSLISITICKLSINRYKKY